MGRLRQGDAVVFVGERLSCGGAAGEGDAEFAGEACGEGFDKEGVKEGGIFFISYVEDPNVRGGAEDAPASQGPSRAADFKDPQAVCGQHVGEGTCAFFRRRFLAVQGGQHGGKAPSVGAEDFAAYRMVMHVAQASRRIAVGINTRDGRFPQFGKREVADSQGGDGGGRW